MGARNLPKPPRSARMDWTGMEDRLRTILRETASAMEEREDNAAERALHRIDACLAAFTLRGESLLPGGPEVEEALDIPTREARSAEWDHSQRTQEAL